MTDLFAGVLPFAYVAEEKSFRRAAERLGVTAAAVSKAVGRLEEELGVRLLNRTTRRVSLSPEGELYLARCREAIAQVRAGRDLVAMAGTAARGPLEVSLSPALGSYLVGRLPAFLARYPGIEVNLHLSDRLTRLVDERIDVAIRIGDLPDSTLVSRLLLRPRWTTVAAPAYLAQRGTPESPADLVSHACLAFRSPRGRIVPWTFLDRPRAGDTQPHLPTGNLIVDAGSLLVNAAVAGAGLCQTLDVLVEDAIREGRLVEVLADYAAPGPPVHALCIPGQQRTPRIRSFLDHLAGYPVSG